MKKALSYEEFLGIGLKIFRIFAWKSPNGSILQSFYYWLSMLVLFLFTFSIFMFVNENLGQQMTLLQLSQNFLSLAINALVIGRMFLLLFYKYDNLQFLFEKMRALMPMTLEEQKIFKVEQERRPMAIKNWLFLIVYSWNTFVSTIMPVMAAIQRSGSGESFEIKMPVELWLPFDQKGFVAQILIFLLIVWWNFIVCTVSFTTEIVYITAMSTLCMQFDILRRRFEDVRTKQELIEMIDRHNELIDLSEAAKESFSLVIFTNFINGTLMLCFLGFCLLSDLPSELKTAFIAYLVANLIQHLNLCWNSQRLIDCSQSIGDTVYNTNWEDSDRRTQETMRFIIFRSQKAESLNAYKFQISLPSYTTILTTAYSYFSLMRNLNNLR